MGRVPKTLVVALACLLLSGCTWLGWKTKQKREAVLREDLFQMRAAIDQYSLDKLRAPQSLDDLVTAGYIREIPVDPFTMSNKTWVVVKEDIALNVDQKQPGIADVHSGSMLTAIDGTPYRTW